jgi:hypothetical protein
LLPCTSIRETRPRGKHRQVAAVIIDNSNDYSDGGIVIRTQIQLTEDQSRRLHQEARRSGKSVAEVIRRSVDEYLEQASERSLGLPTREAAMKVAGLFHSGNNDVAARHDDYLDEAYGPSSDAG